MLVFKPIRKLFKMKNLITKFSCLNGVPEFADFTNSVHQVNFYDGPRETTDLGSGTRVEVQKNKDYQSLECILPDSYPRVEAVWYKNGEKIADERRMFILPRETYFGRQRLFGGTLIIM